MRVGTCLSVAIVALFSAVLAIPAVSCLHSVPKLADSRTLENDVLQVDLSKRHDDSVVEVLSTHYRLRLFSQIFSRNALTGVTVSFDAMQALK